MKPVHDSRRFTVIICTRNRPQDLNKALASVARSRIPVHEVIVSDDSTDDRTRELLVSNYPGVVALSGPRRGLAANRNHALQSATGTHVLFIDDDVVLASDFFSIIDRALNEKEGQGCNRLILTGLENKNGTLISPHDQTFLGFQAKAYRTGDAMKTIVINSTVFPAALFQQIRFDEQLVYGYEEVDIATRAVGMGYAIELVKEAVNKHYPSEINRDFYKPHIAASRLYVTYKRYRSTEGKRLKSVCYFTLASMHMLLHGAVKGGGRGFLASHRAIRSAAKYIRNHYKNDTVRNAAVEARG